MREIRDGRRYALGVRLAPLLNLYGNQVIVRIDFGGPKGSEIYLPLDPEKYYASKPAKKWYAYDGGLDPYWGVYY